MPDRTLDRLLLRYRAAVATSAIRRSLRPGQRTGTAVVWPGGALLAAVWGHAFLVQLAHATVHRAYAMLLMPGLIAAAALAGIRSGRRAAARMAALAQLPFLRVQPWDDGARRRACRLGRLPDAALQLGAAAVIGFFFLQATGSAHAAAGGMAAAFAFAICFLLTPIPLAAQAWRPQPELPMQPAGRRAQALISRLDADPRWLAVWALRHRSGAVGTAAIALALTLGLFGAAGSIATRTVFPGLLAAILGGHIIFILALRAQPLAAQALRVQPIRFGGAVWAVARLPLLASLAWFLMPAVATLAAGPAAVPAITAGAVWLLLFDGIYTILTAAMPTSPRTVMATYGVTLLVAAQNLALFSLFLELPLLALFLLVFWRRGRNSFAHG